MNREEFKRLFRQNIDEAIAKTRQITSINFPEEVEIELYAPGESGSRMSIEDGVDILFLGEDKFYRLIDVSVLKVEKRKLVIFVRVSGHAPSDFRKTWNTPPGNGPFKVMVPMNVEETRE